MAHTARIDELDYVRGLAVLGILFVNMPLYMAPLSVFFNTEVTGWFPAWYDRAALWLIRIVAQAKFYTIFSFLFGVGFGVQMARAEARGVPRFGRLYARRLAILFAFGAVHLFVFWLGDVLHLYALMGFLLLLFRKRRQKTLLVWALCITFLPVIGGTLFFTVQAFRDTPEKKAERVQKRAEERAKQLQQMDEVVKTYAAGSRREVFAQRGKQVLKRLPGETFWAQEILVMFLLGLWVARTGALDDITRHLPVIRRLFWWGLAVGVPATLALALWRVRLGPDGPMPAQFASQILGHVVARPFHALFYTAGMVLLVQSEAWRRRLAPLAAVGRMALTSYIAQTAIGVTIFNGVGFGLYGLGLYGRVGFAAGLALTFAIWALQLWFSTWWLARYRYGPLEWLWRSLTYGTRQPMSLAVTGARSAP